MTRTAAASPAVYREHPIKILRYSAKNLWLLIFPLLRSLRFYPFSFQNLIDWGAGVWFDLLVALLILGIGTLRWHACIYYFDEVTIRSRSGILLQRVTEIPLERIASTVEEHPFYLRPLRAACLRISTAAGAMPDADMQLTLYLRDLHRLRQNIPVLQNGKSEEAAYHTPAWRTMLFSALFSSSFSGALYIATLFFQGGRITSDLLEQFQAQQLLEDATDRASTAFHGVPRIAVTIGIIILALWLISFGRNLLRYGRFKMRFGSEFISVHTGIITRRRYHLRDTAIIFPDLRQNLVMKIFGMVSLHIRCPGYGSRRDTLPVLIPLMRKKSSQPLLERLHAVPVMEHPKLHAKSNIKFFWSFVAAGDRTLRHFSGAIFPAVAAARCGSDHPLFFRHDDYSAGVAALHPHCGDGLGIGHHGRPAPADALLQLVHIPHHHGEPCTHRPHGHYADAHAKAVWSLPFIYHLQRTPAAAVQADGAPGEKGPGDPGDAGAGSIITKIFPVSAWVRKPGFFCKNADKVLKFTVKPKFSRFFFFFLSYNVN